MLWCSAGLLELPDFLVNKLTPPFSLGWIDTAFSFTKPACFLECLLVRLKGSRENCTPPPVLRLTRKELLLPVITSVFGSCQSRTPNLRTISQMRSPEMVEPDIVRGCGCWVVLSLLELLVGFGLRFLCATQKFPRGSGLGAKLIRRSCLPQVST